VVFATLWVAAAGAIACIYLVANNTIDNNGAWISSKQGLELPLMGAYSYTRKTQALARGHLDLGAWHGFQELIFRNSLYFVKQIDFDFSPGRDFSLILTKDDKQFSGIRLAWAQGVDSAYFIADAGGGFLSSRKLTIPANLALAPWAHFSLKIQEGMPVLTINGMSVDLGDLKLSEPYTVGFRGSAISTLIDNLVILREGLNPIEDSFFSTNAWRPVFHLSLIAVVFGTVCLIAAMSMAGIAWRRVLCAVATFGVVGVVVGGVVCAYVYYYYASTYPSGSYQAREEQAYLENCFESRRVEIRSRYGTPPAPDVERILFIGASQTYGSGAARQADTMVDRAEQRLNQLGAGRKFECVNAALVGATANTLFDAYQQEWAALLPRTVVVNLGNNDLLADQFEAHLEKFATLSEERGIRLVFSLEATASSMGLAMHPVMRRVAEKHQVPLIDLHGFLQTRQDQGFLWWDSVHLTTFGQRLAGEHIAEFLLSNNLSGT